jgi:hypothetical protein
LTSLPIVRGKVAAENKKVFQEFYQKYHDQRKATSIKELPDKPWTHDQIMKRVNNGDEKSRVLYTDTGKLSGCLFYADDKHWNFVADVMR